MATRCPRCRAHDLVLETFGVFRCETCGRVDIDGQPSIVIGGVAVASIWSELPSMARLFVGLLFAIDVGFFVALLSPEARRHYEMRNEL